MHLPPGTQRPWTLFTPRGEQRWAAAREPHFPVPAEDDSEPGTVFRTSHGGRDVTWVVCDRVTGRSIRYARVTEGQDAGSVTVTLDHGGHAAVVSYDLTALSPAGAAHLAEFARGYPGVPAPLGAGHRRRARGIARRWIDEPLGPDPLGGVRT